MDAPALLIHDAEVAGERVDLRLAKGEIREISPRIEPRPSERVLEARGGALIHGLHDHHIHLRSLAASLASVDCGPIATPDSARFVARLRDVSPVGGWLRGTGYFESVAGGLDRDRLDEIRNDVPIRIQHRSGSMWFMNSRALEAIGIEGERAAPRASIPEGVERDAAGRVTGRLFRVDEWLRARLPETARPDLSLVGRQLVGRGVVAATDATPSNDLDDLASFRQAQGAGVLPIDLFVMGSLALGQAENSTTNAAGSKVGGDPVLAIDAHKILLDEPALPSLDQLITRIEAAHAMGRPVAIHTVTRVEIHFALAALAAARPIAIASSNGRRVSRDRLEHASVAPDEAIDEIERLGVRIVTQPNFVAERGDAYHEDVHERDLAHLYRVKSWLARGVSLRGGTDAPFGKADPWAAMRAAVHRRTRAGRTLSPHERVSPEEALALFRPIGLPPADVRRHPRSPRIAVGDRADLCLLAQPWRDARESLSSDLVVETVRGGSILPR